MLDYKVFPFIDPELVFANIANTEGAIFLDSSGQHSQFGRYSFILLNPIQQYSPHDIPILMQLQQWSELIAANATKYDANLPPFTGGLAGYFSYDLNKQLEYIPSTSSKSVADYYLGLYNQVMAFDCVENKCYVMVSRVNGINLDYQRQLDDLISLYYSSQSLIAISNLPAISVSSNFSKIQYMEKVALARQMILNGDIFEVNIAQKFSGKVDANYRADMLYRKLRRLNEAPFSAWLNLGKLKILSASPERFVMLKNGHIEACPIKGTCKRSHDLLQDRQLADALSQSTKNRAENIMIVDLMRNDLGKICKPGSVKVSKLCNIESFTNVHHLVSTIEGDLKDNVAMFDIIPACFPGGSVTGAPKIRAMQIIEELENSSRGVYCGSIGYFGFNGNVDLSIAIRTIVVHNNELSFQVGGAVTLDSDPEDEYNETLIKGQKLLEAINK